MEVVIFNPQKGRLETINAEVNETHTPWFCDEVKTGDICAITDLDGNLPIKEQGHAYPVLAYNITRADIDHKHQLARQMKNDALFEYFDPVPVPTALSLAGLEIVVISFAKASPS